MTFTAEVFHSDTYGTMLRIGTEVYFCPSHEQLVQMISCALHATGHRTYRDIANLVTQAMIARIDRFLQASPEEFPLQGHTPYYRGDDCSVFATWNDTRLVAPSSAALANLIKDSTPRRSLRSHHDTPPDATYIAGWLDAHHFRHTDLRLVA